MFSELAGASPPGPPPGLCPRPTGGLQRPQTPDEFSNRDLTQMRMGGERTEKKYFRTFLSRLTDPQVIAREISCGVVFNSMQSSLNSKINLSSEFISNKLLHEF